MKLEQENQDLLKQLKGLNTGKTNNDVSWDSWLNHQTPMWGATPRLSPKINKSLDIDVLEAFLDTRIVDA